jgi:FKBP-type peptidyl-prolyl cis-trans isomerase FklB
MESTIEATGNKVDDLSYVHGFGMAQGLTQQGFSFINMELLGNFFNEFANKTKELVEPQAADTALRALAQTTENFQKINDEQSITVSELFASLFYQTQLFHPAFEDINVAKVSEGLINFSKQENAPAKEMVEAYSEIMEKFQAVAEAESAEKAKEAGKEGIAFLEENAKNEGIVVTESGLQYEIITVGEGEKPTEDKEVTVHYEGTTIDGKVFDSSYARGEKISFGLGQVIKGWTEGLQLMSPGSKYKFYIPQELAYGERGAGADIAPFAALVFTVELFSFK